MTKEKDQPFRLKLSVDDLLEAVKDTRPYPHVKPQEWDQSWREIHQYGIVGWMSSLYGPESQEIATQFGGYFRFDPKNTEFDGELIDIWGNSYIEGKLRLKKKELWFTKTYQNRPAIEYFFEKHRGLWIGEYRMHKDKGGRVGKAEAMLTKFHNNAFGIMSGPYGAAISRR